jgi:hypothetical protein
MTGSEITASGAKGSVPRRVAPVLIGSLFFGAMMAWRHELTSTWTRAAAAGLAFVVLFLTIRNARR